VTTSPEESFPTLTYTDDSGYEWELHQITAHEVANVDTDVRHWKAVLRFYKPSSTPGYPRLLLDFVGLGLPFDEASATDGVMSTWYRGDVTDSWTSNRGGTRTVQGAYMPRMNASGIAAQGGAWNFAFEKLSSTDKRYLRSLWQWNDGGPTDGIEPGAHLNRYMPDRGARSPLLIVADRPDTKFGFYGDLAAPPQFQQSTPGWYPDDPRWRTSLRIVERIC